MSEYTDWLSDQKSDAEWWISKYPFLAIKYNAIYPWLELNSTEYHWLSELPPGWIDAFGVQMCDELLEALGKYADDWIILQAKEKWGSLVIYHQFADKDWTEEELAEIHEIYNNIEKILDKYDNLSYNTCCHCGSPTTKHTAYGWVLPYCDKHYPNPK